MKEKYNIKDSYSYSHSECDEEDFFSFTNLSEIESDICRLQTFSKEEDRNLARKVYKKIQARLRKIQDGNEKSKLNDLSMLIKMKVKTI